MATRPVPGLIVAGAAAHVRASHGIDRFDAGQIGVPSSRSALRPVTWDRTGPADGAWFHCRLCPPGFNRYSAEIGLDEPTPRILQLIRLHLDGHGIANDLQPVAIYHPLTERSGAAITCPVCKESGRDPVFLTDPPFGDARRLRHLVRSHRVLAQRVASMSSIERSLFLEAEDRRALGRPDLGVSRPALRRANRVARSPQTGCLDQALLELMLEETASGRGITIVISELDELALQAPERFSCRLGAHVGELSERATACSPERLAELVGSHFGYPEGSYPVARRTALWRVWNTRQSGRRAQPGSL